MIRFYTAKSVLEHAHWFPIQHPVTMERVLDPCVKSNRYCSNGGARMVLLGQNSLGMLRPNFQLLHKRVDYQSLTIFDQLTS
jgi:hypothetical protein